MMEQQPPRRSQSPFQQQRPPHQQPMVPPQHQQHQQPPPQHQQQQQQPTSNPQQQQQQQQKKRTSLEDNTMDPRNSNASGVGIYFQNDPSNNTVYVSNIVRGGSADRSGVIKPGDVIIKVGNHDVQGESLNVLRNLILGPQGTYVSLFFKRNMNGEVYFYDVELLRGSPEYLDSLKKIQTLQDDSDTLRMKLRNAENHIANLREQIEHLRRPAVDEARIQQLHDELREQGGNLRHLEEKLARAQQIARESERKRLEMEESIHPLQVEKEKLEDRDRERAQQIEELRRRHKLDLERMERSLRQQDEELEAERSRSKQLDSELADAEREIQRLIIEHQSRVSYEDDLRRRFHHELLKAEEALRAHEEHMRATDQIFPALHDLHSSLFGMMQNHSRPAALPPLEIPPLLFPNSREPDRSQALLLERVKMGERPLSASMSEIPSRYGPYPMSSSLDRLSNAPPPQQQQKPDVNVFMA